MCPALSDCRGCRPNGREWPLLRCSALSDGSCPDGSTVGQSGVSGAPSRLGCRSCSTPTAPRSKPPDRHGAPLAGCQAPRTPEGAPESWPEDRSRGHRGDLAGIEPGGDGARRREAGSPSLRHGPGDRSGDRPDQAGPPSEGCPGHRGPRQLAAPPGIDPPRQQAGKGAPLRSPVPTGGPVCHATTGL